MINNIWILIGKKLNGEASAEELLELEELLKLDLADQYQLAILEELWKTNSPVIDSDLENKWRAFEAKFDIVRENEIEEAIQNSIDNVNPKSRVFKLIKYTSLIAASVVLVLLFYTRKHDAVISRPNEITAPKRGISKITLPDGSRVWLNSGSKLVCNFDYGSKCRKISLLGEALFDVVKDEKHPFIVTTPTISIKVLGTRFNVRSYNNNRSSETSLIRGRIELTVLKNPEKKIILKASDKLTVIDNVAQPAMSTRLNYLKGSIAEETPLLALSRVHQAKRDTLPSEALWVEDKLAFDAEDFVSLAEKLEQRYDVSITFKNDEPKKIRFTGRFQNETIQKALKALQTTSYFHYKTHNNQILIY
jgi:transmembrane sensor